MSYFAGPEMLPLPSQVDEVPTLSPSLTGAMVPPKFHLNVLVFVQPSFRQLPWESWSGVGSIVERNEDYADYMA